MPLPQDIIDRARGADILAEAQRRGAKLKRGGAEWAGPCPACGGHDRFAVNTNKQIFNCRGAGEGGDVIKMVMYLDGLPFDEAVSALTGEDVKPKRERAKPAPAYENNSYREKERRRAYDIWNCGVRLPGTVADKYLLHRGLTVPNAPTLRFAAALPYWHQPEGEDRPRSIYGGPALLGVMTDGGGRFAGVHITWISATRPGEKAVIPCPVTGDDLPVKKMRGSKRKAAIRLWHPDGAVRLVMGEGIETALTVYSSEAREIRDGTAYWAALDLGHMAGKAVKTIPHPTLKRIDKRGRVFAQKVSGPVPQAQPDRDLQIPDAITELVLLGDGDSDPFITRQAIRRAGAKYAAPGRSVSAAWAPEGKDFNDVLMGDE